MRPADQFPAPLSSGLPAGQHLPLAVLRQYVAGTLPATEQHLVERHTLMCARCADVLEGLSHTDLATTDRAVHNLQARLRTRVAAETPDNEPMAPMWSWRQLAAAVLLLLVGAGIWLGVRRTAEGPGAPPQVALRRAASIPEAEQAPAPASATTSAATRTDSVGAVASATEARTTARLPRKLLAVASPPARRSRRVVPPVAASEAVAVTETDARLLAASSPVGTGTDAQRAGLNEPLAPRSETVDQEKQEADAASSAGRADTRLAPAAKAKSGRVLSMAANESALNAQIMAATDAPAGTRVVRGRVTNQQNGAGLPGVTVLARGTRTGVTTAADGSFMLLVPDSVQALTFHYIGYTSSEQPLPTSDSTLTLALVPDTRQLSEVVVVRRERPPMPPAVGALPAGGYPAFREYLKKQLQYPEKALKDNKEGTVKLRFVVAVDGSLQGIKVVNSLSEECDAEAVRLLKEGPRWYPAISKGRRIARSVDISVPFRVAE